MSGELLSYLSVSYTHWLTVLGTMFTRSQLPFSARISLLAWEVQSEIMSVHTHISVPGAFVIMGIPQGSSPCISHISRILPLLGSFLQPGSSPFSFLVPFFLLRPLFWEPFFSTKSPQFSLPIQSVCRNTTWDQMPQSYVSLLIGGVRTRYFCSEQMLIKPSPCQLLLASSKHLLESSKVLVLKFTIHTHTHIDPNYLLAITVYLFS